MPLPSFDQLYESADFLHKEIPVVVAGGADVTVLEAMRTACDRGWVHPILAGNQTDIQRLADQHHIKLDGFTLLDSEEPARNAVAQVRSGHAKVLMKGQIATPDLMKAVLDADTGLRTSRVICQIVLMEILPSGRRFLMADTGICIEPSVNEKGDILRSTVEIAHKLGEPSPSVAIMAATEKVSDAMPETLDAVELQSRSEIGEFSGCKVRGPLSFDLAYVEDAAQKKSLDTKEFGVADIMLFPNLVSANLTVKAIMYTAECRFGGLLWGADCPVVFMSRADTTETRLNSLALVHELHR